MLRSRIDASRVVPTPDEKAELLRLGSELNHEVSEVIHIVKPKTYRRWLGYRKRDKWFNTVKTKVKGPGTLRSQALSVCCAGGDVQ